MYNVCQDDNIDTNKSSCDDGLVAILLSWQYYPDSEDELNGYFGIAEHDDNSDNDKEEHIPRSKWQPIKNTKKNKPSSITLKETLLKVTHTKKTND